MWSNKDFYLLLWVCGSVIFFLKKLLVIYRNKYGFIIWFSFMFLGMYLFDMSVYI